MPKMEIPYNIPICHSKWPRIAMKELNLQNFPWRLAAPQTPQFTSLVHIQKKFSIFYLPTDFTPEFNTLFIIKNNIHCTIV